MNERFRDRRQAGRMLGERLAERYAGRRDAVVLGLPRGGVPVARVIADALGAPLDVLVVRKLGFPPQPELAMGAIATGGVRVLHEDVAGLVGPDVLEQVTRREQDELDRRERAFRGDRAPLDVEGRLVILVDDGVATGSTVRAAIQAVRARGARRIVLAIPTAPPSTVEELGGEADEVVCLMTPEPFVAIGRWYEDFSQLSDDEVRAHLDATGAAQDGPAGG
jgi:predicted phosphoribosyltransferase